MKFEDLTGQRFDKLLVLGIDPENKYNKSGKIQWKCQCDCGNLCYKTRDYFRSQTGISKACTRVCGSSIPVGSIFGRLTVLEIIKDEHRATYRCACSCGKEIIADGAKLKNGSVKSCGCFRKDRMAEIGRQTPINDIAGQRFGKLIAIKPTDKRQNKSIVWECLCDCGNIHLASNSNLQSGDVTRCSDCKIRSKGEEKIAGLLTKANIPYTTEQTFDTCINLDTGRKLRFDFFVNNEYLIEFDGRQHFSAIDFFSKDSSFKELQKRDIMKNEWCLQNNIPLIRIPYTELDYLTLLDIKPSTTKFLIKKGNYYNDNEG